MSDTVDVLNHGHAFGYSSGREPTPAGRSASVRDTVLCSHAAGGSGRALARGTCPMLSTGSLVSGYVIQRVLGSGGMGTVYLAQNPELPRLDALKVLSGELSRQPEFRARFVREADVASRLSHPNIVSVYQRGETADGQLWIAMQYVDGTDADDALRSGTMTPNRALHVITEVATALDYAHQHHVVHRDVKPGNFLLSGTPGTDERVLLGDFGIARALDEVGLTMTGSVVATMAYAAPEVLAGTQFDGRADVYSLACTLFRLLTGKTPFSGANGPAAVMMAHLHRPPPRVTERAPGLPRALDGVIATAMAKDPAQRFPSAEQFASAARAALSDRATSATAPWTAIPSSEVSSQPEAGPRTMVGPSGQPTQLRPTPPPTVAPRRGRRRWLIGAAAAVVLVVGGTVAAVQLSGDSTPVEVAEPSSTTTASSPRTPPTFASSGLLGLLPPADAVKAVVGGADLVVDTSPRPLDTGNVVEQECRGAMGAGEQATYDGSGYQGFQLELVKDQADASFVANATVAVATFLTADQAEHFFDQQPQKWGSCAARTLTFDYGERGTRVMRLGPTAVTSDRILTLPENWVDAPQQQCEHALAVRNNVVIDVQACSATRGQPAVTILRDIVAKIAQS